MFTGIIEQLGLIVSNISQKTANRLSIRADFTDLTIGESISVNGVCLTLTSIEEDILHFDVSPETLNLTNLGQLNPGSKVNLERALLATARFGGHYVSGHVDGTALVEKITIIDDCMELKIHGFKAKDMQFLLQKGSICIDGVSLTINKVDQEGITLMLIPLTLSKTTLGLLIVGQTVNIEFDYLTRIIAHQLAQLSGEEVK